MSSKLILLAAFAALAMGCNRSGSAMRSFNQEFDLTLKAGRGQLTDDEKANLLKENHPILAQVGEPEMVPLMELFARLTPELHAQLLRDSYIKWRYIDLPEDAREATQQIISLLDRRSVWSICPPGRQGFRQAPPPSPG